MQRNKIKADGTVYAAKESGSWYGPVRIVETERLWTVSRRIRFADTVRLASDRETMSASSSRGRDAYWSSTHHVTGFLAVRATHNDADALESLRTLDMTHVRAMPTDKANELNDWNNALPEGLSVDVVVAREVKATWEDHIKAEADKNAQYRAEREERQRQYERANGVCERLDAVLKEHGLYQRHSSTEGRVLVSLDAEQFMDLIERLSRGNDA